MGLNGYDLDLIGHWEIELAAQGQDCRKIDFVDGAQAQRGAQVLGVNLNHCAGIQIVELTDRQLLLDAGEKMPRIGAKSELNCPTDRASRRVWGGIEAKTS